MANVSILLDLSASAYLDTTNTELDKSTEHLSAGNLVGGTTDRALDKQTVIVRLRDIRDMTLLSLWYKLTVI